MTETVESIGLVRTTRGKVEDDFWGATEACIVLAETFTADALAGVAEYSHVEIVFLLNQVDPVKVETGLRHPRNNRDWPAVGIFAQRAKARPNRIGCTICRVVRVEGTRLFVAELDAIDGTPVLDIKPVLAEFLPREEVRQPAWSRELMRDYWRERGDPGVRHEIKSPT